MKKDRKIRYILVFVLVLIFTAGFNFEINAQRRTKSKRARAASKSNSIYAQRRKGAEDVAIQIKNVTKFVFVLGGVANGIEQIDKEIKEGKASREVKNKNAAYKADVIRSVRALRSGLVRLEVDFRTKPGLKPYLRHIQGIIGASARADDLATYGRFNDAGKQLLLIVETLSDVLVEMP